MSSETIYKRYTASCLQCRSTISLQNFSKHLDSKQCLLYGGKFGHNNRTSKECLYCKKSYNKIISVAQHEVRCKQNPNRKLPKVVEPIKCIFCEKIYTSNMGLGSHQVRCPHNPDRKLQTPSVENKIKGIEKRLLKISKYWEDPANKLACSKRMKDAVISNPASYSSSNRGRTKQIIYNNVKFQGQWELDFYIWCEQHNQPIERNTRWFDYKWDGDRKYNPDFYLPDLRIYVEVKGYETDRDRAKWQYFPEKLLVIKQKEITQIRNNIFILNDKSVNGRPGRILTDDQ